MCGRAATEEAEGQEEDRRNAHRILIFFQCQSQKARDIQPYNPKPQKLLPPPRGSKGETIFPG